MNLEVYVYIATLFSFIVFIALAYFYLIPIINKKSLGTSLTLLLWPHVFRFVSLSVYSAAEFKSINAVPSELHQVVIGDTLSGVLAFLAILSIRYRKNFAIVATWIAVVFGSIDFVVSTARSMLDGLPGNVSGFTWFIFVFVVPPLIITETLLMWQLISRRTEKLHTSKQ